MSVELKNDTVRDSVFRAVEVVGVEDNGNLWNNLVFANKHSRQNVLLHGNGIREIVVILIQIQHNLSSFS